MTIEILRVNDPEINWDKPQWLITEDDQIVFSNGTHKEDTFEGVILPQDGCDGKFSSIWKKVFFKPIPNEGLIIKIKNDE